MIKIGLVDDHKLILNGLKTLIEKDPECKVQLEASNGKELMSQLEVMSVHPDIIMLDITMPVMNGFETIIKLKSSFPEIKVIVLTLISNVNTIIHMIQNGANGYVCKSSNLEEIINAIKSVHTNGIFMGEWIKKEYFRNEFSIDRKGVFHGKETLTQNEIDFIRLASTNLNYKEIAKMMVVSPKTIENYRNSLFAKFSINNRAAMALIAIKLGLVDPFIDSL